MGWRGSRLVETSPRAGAVGGQATGTAKRDTPALTGRKIGPQRKARALSERKVAKLHAGALT